jgi:hypothetical protein
VGDGKPSVSIAHAPGGAGRSVLAARKPPKPVAKPDAGKKGDNGQQGSPSEATGKILQSESSSADKLILAELDAKRQREQGH